MVKLNKHAAIIDQLHSLVKKQAEAESSVIGTPGKDTEVKSLDAKTETVDKNAVKPEDNKNEVKQELAKEDAGKVVSSGGVKSATDKTTTDLNKLSEDILSLIQKHSEEAQTNIVGTPGKDTAVAAVDAKTETVDKNAVKPEDNKNEVKQDESKEEAGKVVSDAAVKSASVPEVVKDKVEAKITEKKDESLKEASTKLASEISSYNLGASLIYDLVKSNGGGNEKSAADKALLKESGRRDFDILINQMAEQIKHSSPTPSTDFIETEKVASETSEIAGAAYFNDLYKGASESLLIEKVATLEEELKQFKAASTFEALAKKAELDKAAAEQKDAVQAEKIAGLVLATLENKLKSEAGK